MYLANGIDQDLTLHVTMQLSDRHSFQNHARVVSDRTELSKKSLHSLLHSIVHCVTLRPKSRVHVCLIYDGVSPELMAFCQQVARDCPDPRISVSLQDLAPRTGIAHSIRGCYHWLQQHGTQLVAHFQDDYVFKPQTIEHCIDVLLQVVRESDTEAIVTPFQYWIFWRQHYKNRATPRTIILGQHTCWIQLYDISCSFMTTHNQFSQHWEIYDMFLALCEVYPQEIFDGLESKSLNHILTRKGVLAIGPMNNLSFHLQTDYEHDPYQDWRPLWQAIDLDRSPWLLS